MPQAITAVAFSQLLTSSRSTPFRSGRVVRRLHQSGADRCRRTEARTRTHSGRETRPELNVNVHYDSVSVLALANVDQAYILIQYVSGEVTVLDCMALAAAHLPPISRSIDSIDTYAAGPFESGPERITLNVSPFLNANYSRRRLDLPSRTAVPAAVKSPPPVSTSPNT